jgi:hypothetical protein
MPEPIAYIPGFPPQKNEPLSRYLPPIPDGVVSRWLKDNIPIDLHPDGNPWVLDPFCASPRLVLEAARCGYRVLTAANNPVARFMLETAADPPTQDDLRASLAELAAARKGNERLEPHISSLYHTNCDSCGNLVAADAFYWERDTNKPFARVYQCPHCGQKGEYPVTSADIARAAHFSGSGLHHARALERVTSLDDPDRNHVDEALATYLPRALYALFSIINRLEGLPLTPLQRKCLIALCLTACDQANTLWQYPTVRARPKQLTIPARFREINIWLAMEQGIEQWASSSEKIPIVRWPQKPSPESGICVYDGRLKDLVETIGDLPVKAVVAALPRPNQAFWTLSALWAGWLWGREAVTPFKSALRRRRYDWSWHTIALHAAFDSLSTQLSPGTPMLGLIGEIEPGFLSAAMIAAEASGFDLQNLSLRRVSGQAQIFWSCAGKPQLERVISDKQGTRSVTQAAQEYLLSRGEPASYMNVHAAGLLALVDSHLLDSKAGLQIDPLTEVNTALETALLNQKLFLRYGGSEKSLEVGQWWLQDVQESKPPLADRVEKALVNFLIYNPHSTILDIDTYLCAAFPGLLTPDIELIHICLESYGEQAPPDSSQWILRENDQPRVRRSDLDEMQVSLTKLAQQLGFRVRGDRPMLWEDMGGNLRYVFHIIASAIIGELVYDTTHSPNQSLIVLPGGRANLVAYKLTRDRRLRQAVERGWRFIKYRQVRMLAETPALTKDTLDDFMSQDALTYDQPQLRLF